VSAPRGFIEATALSPDIHKLALAGHPSWQKLIGWYYQPDALAEILRSGTTEEGPICQAYADREFGSEAEATAHFNQVVANAKKEAMQKFDRNNPAIDRILRNYENVTKNLGNGVAVSADGVTMLGDIGEGSNYYAGSMIFAYTWSNGSQSAPMPFALAVAWIRIKKQIVTLKVAYPFTAKSSILQANDALRTGCVW
jgi:hypothetical protein